MPNSELDRNEQQFSQANNNRLANYIDKVRQLQTENRRMTKQIQVNSKWQSVISDMRNDIKMYDEKAADHLYSGTLNHFSCSDATTTLR